MATAVELPQLGNTVDECLITRWVKRKGDAVSAGDTVLEIETDKTTFEVAAPVAGTVLETFFDEGALVKVFTNIFVIGEPGESVAAFDPRAAPRESESGIREQQPAGRDPQSVVPDPRSATCGSQPAPSPSHAPAPLSPRARRFAAQHAFDPAAVIGSGPGGRVLESDVRRAYAASQNPASQHHAAAQKPGASNLRATIARRMRESLASTAQYTLHASAGAGGLLALRARIKEAKGPVDITINDLIMFCTIRALLDAPDVNAELVDGRLVRHAQVHLAFAVDTPRGLLAPVIEHAHELTLAGLAQRAKTLANQAVAGTIAPDDLTGATFTISNLGGLGIESFTPLINLPQVAILGVGAIQLKPIRVGGRVEFVDAIGLSLTCDHQAIDGAPGARFLAVLKDTIERVESFATI